MKLNILLTAGIISVALLSGCDKGSEQTATTSGETATPAVATPAPAEAPAPAATPAPAETTAPAATPAPAGEEAK